ncbi:putative virion structural protein [Erwinia phage vB_EamM_Stratton]|uniref:Putative virion structural protein n=1 Tax=Erwinia phage vB_EamM_Stratton TaxID=1883378 RepID=A0A1B2IH71_9CAUD|nr:putative virion structural protein [Erwinia phage vB_EamM_Stratton]
MSLKLTWANPNTAATAIRIYRKDTTFDSSSLPAPLAEIGPLETTYTDTTAVEGNTYYYIIGTVNAIDEVFTPTQKITVSDNRGVGPGVLLGGNGVLGYFGTVAPEDFINSSSILAQAASVTGIPSTLISPTWHKFIRNGKILYVPDTFFGTSDWRYLYQAGFVYGVDGNGPPGFVSTGVTLTNQLRVVVFKGQRYKIRLLRGWSDGPETDIINFNGAVSNHDNLANTPDNEYNDLVYALCKFTPYKQRVPNFANLEWDKLIGLPTTDWSSSGSQANQINTYRFVCQERWPSGSVLNRGQREVTWGQNASPHRRDHVSQIAASIVTQSLYWLPVLELID